MKKIIFLLAAVMLTASCCGCFSQRVDDPERFQFISKTSYKVKDENRNAWYPDVIKYQFEGHYYLMTTFGSGYNGVIHDPNCPTCHQKYMDEQKAYYENVIEDVLKQIEAGREAEKKDIQELKKIIIRNTTSILNKINENDIEYD